MKRFIIYISFFFSIIQAYSQAPIICTIAGNGSTGYNGDNIPSKTASLNGPAGIAVDNLGNIYIADYENHRVRKVTPNGIITTIAGTGIAGFSGDNGQAISAKLNYPINIALDKFQNIYISDYQNNRIRKIMPNGIITTVAGGGAGGDGGLAINAQLSRPNGVAFDNFGNMYIAEISGNKVRKVDINGVISTFAGGGGSLGDGGLATSAMLIAPNGIVFDSLGNLYIADQGNNRIRKVDVNGIISTIAGDGTSGFSGDGGPATLAKLRAPNGIAVDNSNNIVFTDFNNHCVRKIDASGKISTIAGNGSPGFSGDGGHPLMAKLSQANGIAYDGSGNYYISEYSSYRIRKVYIPQLMEANLTSDLESESQTVCIDSMIIPITYSTNNVDNIIVSGLPSGIDSFFNSGFLTISGRPIQSGVYTYTVSFNQNTICTNPIVRINTIKIIDCSSTNVPRLTVNSVTVCPGQAAVLTASEGSNFLWSNGSTTQSITVIENTTTSYTVSSTIGCCRQSSVATVFVANTLPIVLVDSKTVCSGISVNLSASGATSYTWSPAVGLNITVGATVIATPTVSITYTVTGSNICGESVGYSKLTIGPNPTGRLWVNPKGCESMEAMLIADGGESPYIFEYSINQNNSVTEKTTENVFNIKTSSVPVGTYTYSLISLTDANNCTGDIINSTETISVHKNPQSIFDVSPIRTSLLDSEVSFQNYSLGADSWLWIIEEGVYNSSEKTPEPYSYKDTGRYAISLIVATNEQCYDTARIVVQITQPFSIYIPNTFTPDFNSMNDVFKPKGEGILNYEMNIFNRWGEVVFNTKNFNEGWDGSIYSSQEPAPAGDYVYTILLKSASDKHDYLYRGVLNLMR